VKEEIQSLMKRLIEIFRLKRAINFSDGTRRVTYGIPYFIQYAKDTNDLTRFYKRGWLTPFLNARKEKGKK
jgi:hypothetical protein